MVSIKSYILQDRNCKSFNSPFPGSFSGVAVKSLPSVGQLKQRLTDAALVQLMVAEGWIIIDSFSIFPHYLWAQFAWI